MANTYNATQNNRNLVPGGADDGPLEKDFSRNDRKLAGLARSC